VGIIVTSADSQWMAAFLGHGGLAAMAKISYMFLAAIAVRMIVQGVQNIWS